MKEFWSKRIYNQQAYTAGEQPKDKKYIKLNTNENPYPPSPKVKEAIMAALNDLRLYPDPNCTEIIEAVSEVYGVSTEKIFAGNGSDEILAMSFLAFYDPGRPVTFPDITYTFYPVYSELYGLSYNLIPLNEDFTVPVERLFRSPGGVVLANPNAPTGIALKLYDIERIVSENPDFTVIIDEAYVEYETQSAVSLIDKYANLLVVRTSSKSYSLAGLRVGWAIGNENLINALNVVKNSFNSYTLGRPALAGGAAGIRDREYFEMCRKKVIFTRRKTAESMQELGFELTPSSANFLFAEHPKINAETLFHALRERGILVRYFNKPRIGNRLRISVGTDYQMSVMVEQLSDILRHY
ncbi:MAG: histidinol-phosphate transaminase [Clostridiales bacterium]|nr:histidinol-phosphate transaminase [Clostridiales bacterium]